MTRILQKHIVLCSLIFIAGCSGGEYSISTESSGTEIVTGYFPRTLLQDTTSFPWFEKNYSVYDVDSAMLDKMHSIVNDHSITFLLVLGTWCSDSKKVVPRIFKIIDALKIPSTSVQCMGVDRSKKDNKGITDRYRIHKVPTLVIFKDGVEVGRIVEHPFSTLEIDLHTMISSQ